MNNFIGEKIEKKLRYKDVYYYYDNEKNIRQISKEILKNKDETVHYPIGYNGGSKYNKLTKFVYRGFKNKLPIGVNKSAIKGYGFTRQLKSFGKYIDEKLSVNTVIIEKDGNNKLDIKKKQIYLSDNTLSKLNRLLKNIGDNQKSELNNLNQDFLFSIFPKQFKKSTKSYKPNSLSILISSWSNSIDEFSEDDKIAIKDLFNKLSVKGNFFTSDLLAKTKEIIDSQYIIESLNNYNRLLQHKADGTSLEKKWQKFLKTNSWIFSYILAQPVILYKDEAYVGGKSIDNKNGKFCDFLLKNNLSNNVSFLEIKTHKTKLLDDNSYRGDDVFCANKELTGCINQVLSQRDLFQKEFYQNKYLSKSDSETFNSKCIILLGMLSNLSDNQKKCFELFRNNSRDVDILTFDELQHKIIGLQSIMTKNLKHTKNT